MRRTELDSLDAFLAAARDRGVRAAAMQEVDEVRPRQRGSAVEVGRQRFVDVVGYAAGEVIVVRLDDADVDAVAAALAAAGLRVRRRSANLG